MKKDFYSDDYGKSFLKKLTPTERDHFLQWRRKNSIYCRIFQEKMIKKIVFAKRVLLGILISIMAASIMIFESDIVNFICSYKEPQTLRELANKPQSVQKWHGILGISSFILLVFGFLFIAINVDKFYERKGIYSDRHYYDFIGREMSGLRFMKYAKRYSYFFTKAMYNLYCYRDPSL